MAHKTFLLLCLELDRCQRDIRRAELQYSTVTADAKSNGSLARRRRDPAGQRPTFRRFLPVFPPVLAGSCGFSPVLALTTVFG
jgi:hypothetical protein